MFGYFLYITVLILSDSVKNGLLKLTSLCNKDEEKKSLIDPKEEEDTETGSYDAISKTDIAEISKTDIMGQKPKTDITKQKPKTDITKQENGDNTGAQTADEDSDNNHTNCDINKTDEVENSIFGEDEDQSEADKGNERCY